MTDTLRINRTTLSPARYQRHNGRAIGVWHASGVGWRLYFAQPWQGRLEAYGKVWSVAMPARGILTLRPTTTTHLVPFAFNGDYSDFESGNANGINPHGDDDPVDVHDRIMQRCPVGRYNVATGELITTPVPGYVLDGRSSCGPYPERAWPHLAYNGEHLIRAYRVALRHLKDPFVKLDLQALLADARLFWEPYGEKILSGPGGQGHGYVGRSWSWFAYLASFVDDCMVDFAERVAQHVMDPVTKRTQRLRQGDFHGNPDPWAQSGVPAGVDVCQDFEEYHKVTVFAALDRPDIARAIARSVLAKPLAKWIRWDDGKGVGIYPADNAQAWAALGTLAEIDRDLAIEYAKRWTIPHHYNGSSVGPFQDLAPTRAALLAWGKGVGGMGKVRAFLSATA